MTLGAFLAVLENKVEIIVVLGDETVADFISDTYDSIIEDYLIATVQNVNIVTTATCVKNIVITIAS